MKPSSAKQKGRHFQQKVCAILLSAFPSLQPDDIRSTSMGAGGEDVQLSPAARALIPHHVECKKHSKFAVYTFFDQAKAHGKKTAHQPLVVIEADRRQPLAIVDFAHYVKLLQIAGGKIASPDNISVDHHEGTV